MFFFPPFFAQINLEKAESAYYLYQNWSKSRLPPKKPMWTDRHKIPGHVWTDRHKIPGHVWTDRQKKQKLGEETFTDHGR